LKSTLLCPAGGFVSVKVAGKRTRDTVGKYNANWLINFIQRAPMNNKGKQNRMAAISQTSA
jgi:hypothetical protein